MGLNIIVRQAKPAHWDKVVQHVHGNINRRRENWNRIGSRILSEQTRRVVEAMPDNVRDSMVVVDRRTDGHLMDSCRELQGHTDWRRDKHFLDYCLKCPEFAGFVAPQRRAFERLRSEAKDAQLTPFYAGTEREERRRADQQKLPVHYRTSGSG